MIKKGFVGFVALIAAACASGAGPLPATDVPVGTEQVSTGKDFTLPMGRFARVNGTPIMVTFRSVTADSRCPSDVQCVSAGDAVINLRLFSTAPATQDVVVHTNQDPRSVEFGGYHVTVVGLAPVPRSGSTISQSSYVVTLRVSSP